MKIQNLEEPTFQKKASSSFASLQNNGEKKKSIPIAIVAIIVLLLAVAVLGYLYFDSKSENIKLKKNEQNIEQTSEEYKEITALVGDLVDLAEDENLNIARVDDPKVLIQQNQEFYKDVKEGHYLVVMPKSQRILIFDKEKNKIVNFSSYSIKVELIPEDNIPASEKPLNIEIRHTGTVDQQTIERVEQVLREASQSYNIVGISQTNVNHTGFSIVLLNRQNKPNMSQNIIAHSGTNTIHETLPAGEASTNADVVLLIGNN